MRTRTVNQGFNQSRTFPRQGSVAGFDSGLVHGNDVVAIDNLARMRVRSLATAGSESHDFAVPLISYVNRFSGL